MQRPLVQANSLSEHWRGTEDREETAQGGAEREREAEQGQRAKAGSKDRHRGGGERNREDCKKKTKHQSNRMLIQITWGTKVGMAQLFVLHGVEELEELVGLQREGRSSQNQIHPGQQGTRRIR